MLFEKSPYLRFFPVPPPAQGFQSQHGAIGADLNGRSQKREHIARIPPGSVAPKIQPCVRFVKYIILFHQPLRDAAWETEEAISIGGIDGSIHARSTGALDHPILNPVLQLLGGGVESVCNISQLLQLLHNLQCLCPALDTQNAFETHNASRPHAGRDLIDMAAIMSLSLAK